jgi:hypothetical protein
LEIEKGEDFKILFDLFVEWAEILLNYPFCWIWEIMAQNPSLKKFRSYILMWHRTRGVSSHSRGPHRTPYTCSQIIGLHKGDRISEITILEEKMNLKIFFGFPLRRKNSLEYNNMKYGENLKFSSFFKNRIYNYISLKFDI